MKNLIVKFFGLVAFSLLTNNKKHTVFPKLTGHIRGKCAKVTFHLYVTVYIVGG